MKKAASAAFFFARGVLNSHRTKERRMDGAADYRGLKLKLDGLVPPGRGFFRNMLFDQLYASIPKDPNITVPIYNAEIVPGGFTNWHCHNGATFFIALQGLVEANFENGSAKAST